MPQSRAVAEMSSGIEFDIDQREQNESSGHSDSHSASRATGVFASRNPRMTSWARVKNPSFDRFVSLANSIRGIRPAGGRSVFCISLLASIETRCLESYGEAVTDGRLAEMAN